MRRGAAVSLVGLLVLGGYAAADVVDVAPGVLTRAPLPTITPSPTLTPGPLADVPLPSADPSGMPVRPAGTDAPLPNAAGLRAALAAVLGDPALADSSLSIRDALTGAHLLDVAADTPRTPASTVKLLTAVGVDAAFPAGARLRTSVVAGPTPDRIVLVAGGDMLLATAAGDPSAIVGHAGIADLAKTVATALIARGQSAVTLQVDLRYAPGALTASTWPARFADTGLTGRVTMLGLAERQAVAGKPAPADPVGEVAAALAGQLTALGVTTAVDPARITEGPAGSSTSTLGPTTPAAGSATGAPAGAAELGAVESAPVVDLLGLALQRSDNALAESLARQAAFRSGRASDFAGVAAYLRDAVAAAGVDVTGVALQDASGLTAADQAPARVLSDVLDLAVSGRRPGLTRAVAALPVAALTGTLSDRFSDPAATLGAGLVRAKTGTLIGANALAGTVVTRDGRLLVFAALAAGPEGTDQVRTALDRLGATLVTCGCR